MVNIKPSRFGPLRELFAAYDHCDDARASAPTAAASGSSGPGRGHIQYLASVFHPDTPNDVAPSGYNTDRHRARATRRARCEPATSATGFRWEAS